MSLALVSVPGVFCALFGLGLIIMRKTLGRVTASWNLRLWKFATGEREYQLVFTLVGVAFLIISILAMLGIVQFRK